jgi:hypothetical protein
MATGLIACALAGLMASASRFLTLMVMDLLFGMECSRSSWNMP